MQVTCLPDLGSGQYQALSQVCLSVCCLSVRISRFKELRLSKVSTASSVSLGSTRVSLGCTRVSLGCTRVSLGCTRVSKMVQNGPKWSKMVQNGSKWSKMVSGGEFKVKG